MTVKSTTCLHLKTEDKKEAAEPSQRKLRQPDTWWSWVVCAAGVTCNVIIIGCTYCFGIIFPSLLDEFKAGKSKTGKYKLNFSFYMKFKPHAFKWRGGEGKLSRGTRVRSVQRKTNQFTPELAIKGDTSVTGSTPFRLMRMS